MRDQNNKGKLLSKPLTQKKRYFQGGETKIMRKITAYLLIFALVFTLVAPVGVASANTAGEELKELGIIQGGTGGDLMVNSNWNRQDLVVVVSRLLGEEAEAQATATSHTFQDVTNPFYNSYISWAVGKGLIEGRSATVFGFGDDVTNQEFAAIMLRALGYDTKGSAYANVPALALEKGIIAGTANMAGKSTRGTLYGVITNTLKATMKDSEVTLGAQLELPGYVLEITVTDSVVVDANTISVTFSDGVTETYELAEALKANVETEVEVTYNEQAYVVKVTWLVEAVVVDSVTPVDVNKVEVVFNKAVDTEDAVFNIKRGAAIYASTAEWNEAKDTATLKTIINLPAADYTLEVTGLSEEALVEEFTVEAQKAVSVEVTSTTVALKNNEKIAFKVLNQYGKDFTPTVTRGDLGSISVFNVTKGKTLNTANVSGKSEASITDIETDSKVGDTLRVIIVYKGLTAQANVIVTEVSKSDLVTLDGIVLAKDKVRLTAADTEVELAYTLVDQFGKAKKLPANVADFVYGDGVRLVSSNTAIIQGFKTDKDGKLFLKVGTDGTAMVTAIVEATGSVSTISVTVEKSAQATTAVVAAPTMIIAAGDKAFDLGVSLTDQYGTVVESTYGLTVDFKAALAGGDVEFKTDKAKEITVDLTGVTLTETKNVTIEIKRGSTVVGSVAFNVEKNAEVEYIESITFGTMFEKNAVASIAKKDIVARDQYGRTIDAAGFTVAKVDAAVTTFALAGAEFTAGSTAGKQEFEVTLNGKKKKFTLEVIETKDITSYELSVAGDVYASTTAAYHVAPKLTGKTSAGATVNLVSGKVSLLTSDNLAVAKITGGKVEGVKAGTATITAWDGAKVLATATVNVSQDAPVAKAVKFTSASNIVQNGSLQQSNLEIKDQYGVDITAAAFAAGTVVSVSTATVGAEVELSFITANGIVVTKTFTVIAP